MGAELPVFRICHPKPCSRKTHPILGCILRTHGFGWQIRNNGRSAPIFRRQASILLCNWGTFHPSVCEHKKIDTKPIFSSLEQCHNLALILETPEIGETSVCSGTPIKTTSRYLTARRQLFQTPSVVSQVTATVDIY